jgi:peptidoglycan LD-endopeptidase LytH
MVSAVLLIGLLTGPAHATEIARRRLAGGDRYATAATISARSFPHGRPTALLAQADAFADALSAAAFAGAQDAPLLLSGRGHVPEATLAELRRLAAERVVLLGGTEVLAPAVERQLRDAGIAEVERVGSATRYATAAELARRVAETGIGTVSGRRAAFLASGTGFADALAVGPLAYAARLPILLTSPAGLPPDTAEALHELGIEHVYVVGGERAVSAAVERSLGVPSTRLQGSDRTRTAARVARFAVEHLGFTYGEVVLARGDAFPDALAAAPYAGRGGAPLLLTQRSDRLGRGARDQLLATGGAVTRLTALGGPAAVARAVVDDAERAARGITYAFPVQPPSAASYGRTHHDYPATDIFAACGTPVVSPTVGRVDEVSTVDRWDPNVNDGATRGGLSVSIVGDDGVRYYGSHFAAIADDIRPGARVEAGQRLGTVGRTGSARPTPCHLHFGLSPPCGRGDWEVRRGVLYPWPYLDAWKAGEHHSPAAAIAAWATANPQSCPQG